MKKYAFKKDKRNGIIYGTIKITWFGILVLKQNFSCITKKKPKLGKRCWIAEKKESAYVLNKKLCDELTLQYLNQ